MFWNTILTVFSIFLCILLYRTYVVFTPDKAIFEPCSSSIDRHSLKFDQQRLQIFQKLLQFRTISYE
ncbi:unnamed protein product, partial [Rotaria sp. Silwood2]